MCLEGLGLDHLTAVAAHHQVEVVLRRTLAKYWHVCVEGKWQDRERQQVSLRQRETQRRVAKVNSALRAVRKDRKLGPHSRAHTANIPRALTKVSVYLQPGARGCPTGAEQRRGQDEDPQVWGPSPTSGPSQNFSVSQFVSSPPPITVYLQNLNVLMN